jgi:hypothetical protein
LWTNPNNITSKAYSSIGADDNEVLKSAKIYDGSYRILYSGRGNDDDIKRMKALFSDYNFV